MELDLLGFLWLSIPAFFVLWALYAKLEQKSKSVKKQDPGHYLRQGGFLMLCVAITFILDRFVLPALLTALPEFLPPTMFRILLLPCVMLVMSLMVGGSKTPQIQRRDRAGRIKKDKP